MVNSIVDNARWSTQYFYYQHEIKLRIPQNVRDHFCRRLGTDKYIVIKYLIYLDKKLQKLSSELIY